MSVSLTAQCVACRHREEFSPIPTDVPMCPRCFSPMFAVSASATRKPDEHLLRDALAAADQHDLQRDFKW